MLLTSVELSKKVISSVQVSYRGLLFLQTFLNNSNTLLDNKFIKI